MTCDSIFVFTVFLIIYMTNDTRIYPQQESSHTYTQRQTDTYIHTNRSFLPSFITRRLSEKKMLKKIDWNKFNTNQVRVININIFSGDEKTGRRKQIGR